MTDDPWNPGKLMKMSGAYWKSCTIHTGVKLGIFTLIADTSCTDREIAERLHGSPRGVGLLLNALSALGLLHKKGNAFTNTPFSLKFLTQTSPEYIGHILLHHHHLMTPWTHLDKATLTGGPIRNERSERSNEELESFLLGMYNNASYIAPAVAKAVDLSGCDTLLDLGGGPGTYAIHFCKKNPQLKAWVYDLPTTEPFARSIIETHTMTDRVRFIPFDFTADTFHEAYRFDVAWLSHILHGQGEDQARTVVEKAAEALHRKGRLLIHEFVLDNTKDSPLFPALFSLNMLAVTESGRAYSNAELRDMMEGAGLTAIRTIDYGSPNGASILEGTKA